MYKKFWILSILVLLYNPTYAVSGRGIEKAVNAIANGTSHIAQATHAVKYNNMESFAIGICLFITAAIVFLLVNIGARHYSCTPKQYILRLLSFNGTIGRIEFFLSLLLFPACGLSAFVAEEVFRMWGNSNSPSDSFAWFFGLYFCVLYVVAFYLALSQGSKRCHDLGHSGWFQLIPFYCFAMLFQQGKNNIEEREVAQAKDLETQKAINNNKTIVGFLAVVIILLLILIVSKAIGGNSSSGVIDDENSSYEGTTTDTDYYSEPADTASIAY